MKIPEISRQVSIPGGSPNVYAPDDILGAVPSAMQGFGASMGRAATDIANTIEEMQTRKDNIEIGKKYEEFRRITNDIEVAAKVKMQTDDPSGVYDEVSKDIEAKSQEFFKDINPRIAEQLGAKRDQVVNDTLHSVASSQALAQFKYNEETKLSIINEGAKAAAGHADSPTEVEVDINYTLDQLSFFYRDFVVPSDVVDGVKANSASTAIQAALATDSVDSAKQILANYAPELKLKRVFDELTARIKNAEATRNETDFYAEGIRIGEKAGGIGRPDYSKMKEYYLNPENLKALNLSPAVGAQMSQIVDKLMEAKTDTMLNEFRARGMTKPTEVIRAIEIIANKPMGLPMDKFMSLRNSLKAGLREDVLFNDAVKTQLMLDIQRGWHTQDSLADAMYATGITKSKGGATAYTQLMQIQADAEKDRGGRNHLDESIKASESWARKFKGLAQEEALRKVNAAAINTEKRMKEKGIRNNDPQAATLFQEEMESIRKTFFGKVWDKISPFPSGKDTFIPEATPGSLYGQPRTKKRPDGAILKEYPNGLITETDKNGKMIILKQGK